MMIEIFNEGLNDLMDWEIDEELGEIAGCACCICSPKVQGAAEVTAREYEIWNPPI